MKSIALKPPKPAMNIPRRRPDVILCSSCDKPLNRTEECAGCTK
ncbi:hypothetical protein ACTAQI_20195 [Pseudarthrobacter sp. alpha12b]